MTFTSVAAYEEVAHQHLSPSAWGYFAGGSGNHLTLRRNLAAFERIQLLPRMLRGISRARIDTTVLDTGISMPIMVAPMAMQGLACEEADCATARAAGALGTLMVGATEASRCLEDIAEVAGGPLWFQLYVYSRRDIAERLVRRAEAAGYRAIVLTIDAPRAGWWERDAAPVEAAPGIENANFPELECGEIALAALSWDDIGWLRSLTDLPIVLKGILTAEDAYRAVDSGAAAILVSNHGGRALDGVPASIEVLPEIAAAVAGRIEVYLDGGIRRGTDVLKALALGARAVLVGRPVLWGLAADGEGGARGVLELLRDDLEHAMVLAGCADLSDVGAHLTRIAD
ncbi:MAG: alpha-hydroxy-acid oxidizing protein [Chloroflexi bacterium]|nr:alpha-hydroxy-acid oxidizing protein [Chloroflexota bacterium]